MNGPPVVGENVENTQNYYEERSRPLGLEANSNHDTGSETDNGNENTDEAPFTLDNEPKEEEDEENTTS